jgi:hypothetical protein
MAWVATGIAAAGIASSVIGGVMGAQKSASDRDAARQASQAAYDEIKKLNAPPDQSKAILIKHLQSAGVYSPEAEKSIDATFQHIQQSPQGQAALKAQMGGLQMLQDRAATGFSAEDRASLNQIRQQAATDQQGKLEAIKQNMAARGQSGGGSELAQQLSAASASGADESANADKVAAQAQQSALQAAVQSGQLGGQIGAQQFSQQQANTGITNAEQQFNTQNSVARQQRNVANSNQAQQENLANAQRISDVNTGMTNAESLRQSAAQRQYWQDQAQLAGMKSNALLGQAQSLNGQADSTAKMYQGIGSGAAAGLGAAGNAYASMNKSPTTVNNYDYGSAPKTSNDASNMTPRSVNAAFGGEMPYTRYAQGGEVNKPDIYFGSERSALDKLDEEETKKYAPKPSPTPMPIEKRYAYGSDVQKPAPELDPQKAKAFSNYYNQGSHEQSIDDKLKAFFGAGPSSTPQPQGYAKGGMIPSNADLNMITPPPYIPSGHNPSQPEDCPPGYASGGMIPSRSDINMIVPNQYIPQGYFQGGEVGQAGHMFTRPLGMTAGGQVPGQAPVEGDSFQNDTIHALLSPGEVVLPRTIVEHGPDAAYGFLHSLLNKHKQVKKGKQ